MSMSNGHNYDVNNPAITTTDGHIVSHNFIIQTVQSITVTTFHQSTKSVNSSTTNPYPSELYNIYSSVNPSESNNNLTRSTIILTSQSTPKTYMESNVPEPYIILEVIVAIIAIIGNAAVIIVFCRERRLRRRTNYYIVSLAMADFLVGLLGVPFAILASFGLPTNLYACLFTVSLLVVLCTISIFCLVAVSIDRYWAILYPLAYSRNVRTKTAIVIIAFCWVLGSFVGFLPLFGWHSGNNGTTQSCYFVQVMSYNYLVFLYFATILTPSALLLAFYVHIYTVIIKQVRQVVTVNPVSSKKDPLRSMNRLKHLSTGGHQPVKKSKQNVTMLRVLGAARKREVKATQNLSIIVLFFMICWLPLYTINCTKAFCPECFVHPILTFFAIILSHLNSAVNPILYAYHLKDFRAALQAFLYKLLGKEVTSPPDINYRFSVASQQRMQSLVFQKRTSLRPKVYIDSPVWLRQQRLQRNQSADNPEQSTPPSEINSNFIANNLDSVHHTVSAIASVTANADIWSIVTNPDPNSPNKYFDSTPDGGPTTFLTSIDEPTIICDRIEPTSMSTDRLNQRLVVQQAINSSEPIIDKRSTTQLDEDTLSESNIVKCLNDHGDEVYYIDKDLYRIKPKIRATYKYQG